jgi:quercetin dioxygenase-like cupin family protein
MILPMKDSVSPLSEASPTVVFDIGKLLESVVQQEPTQTGKDRTVVLLKTDSLRVVFRSLSEGTALPAHNANGPITVQVLDGQIEFTAGAQTTPLRQGELLALESGVPHSVRALQKSAILITVAVGMRSLWKFDLPARRRPYVSSNNLRPSPQMADSCKEGTSWKHKGAERDK